MIPHESYSRQGPPGLRNELAEPKRCRHWLSSSTASSQIPLQAQQIARRRFFLGVLWCSVVCFVGSDRGLHRAKCFLSCFLVKPFFFSHAQQSMCTGSTSHESSREGCFVYAQKALSQRQSVTSALNFAKLPIGQHHHVLMDFWRGHILVVPSRPFRFLAF